MSCSHWPIAGAQLPIAAALIADHRDPSQSRTGCGYPAGPDAGHWLRLSRWQRLRPAALRSGFKLACGRLPDTGGDLCSQPTISRWENAPTLREIIRLTYALVDLVPELPEATRFVVLDIDDTVDVVHGHQQLAQWNAHDDERCFLPIHVYDAATGAPVTVILRPGKTPSGGRFAAAQSPYRAHPPALAEHPHHHPRGRPLRPRRGDDLVREVRHRLHFRGLRQCCARPPVDAAADDIRVRVPRARPRSAASPRRATRPSRGTRSGGS